LAKACHRRPRRLERLVAGRRRRSRLAPRHRQRGDGLFHQAQFATLQLNSETVEMYFTSDPLAFMKERFISRIGTIRRAAIAAICRRLAVDARLLRNAGRTRRGPKPPALRSEVLMVVTAALAAPVKSLAAVAGATVAPTV
jgi:hypothetical protein